MQVYGKNVAREVLNANMKINKIFLSDNFNNEELLKLINRAKVEPIRKSQSEMDRMTKELHQGIIIEVDDYKYLDYEDIKNDKNSDFIVILDHIEDPRNFGAIIRTCSCAGVDYIIIPNKGEAQITSAVMKTSSGALSTSKIVMVSNLRNTIEKLKKQDFWIIGADMNGTRYTDIDYNKKIALVIGNEGSGLKYIVKNSCDEIASIPLKGSVDSLNASVAAGVLMYEVIRQRG